MNIDISSEPLAKNKDGKDIYLRDIWPSNSEINAGHLNNDEIINVLDIILIVNIILNS